MNNRPPWEVTNSRPTGFNQPPATSGYSPSFAAPTPNSSLGNHSSLGPAYRQAGPTLNPVKPAYTANGPAYNQQPPLTFNQSPPNTPYNPSFNTPATLHPNVPPNVPSFNPAIIQNPYNSNTGATPLGFNSGYNPSNTGNTGMGINQMGGAMSGAMGGVSSSSGFGISAQFEDDEFANEPPLLEELGINVEHIVTRIKSVVFFRQVKDEVNHNDWDLGGPLAIVSSMAFFLALAGKVHFGAIYGIGIVGCVGAWLLVNAISPKNGIDLYTTVSILGYGLLPTVLLAACGLLVNLQSSIGGGLATATVFWCTATASRFFEVGVDLDNQRWLVAYPIALIYVCFAILTVF